MAWPHLPKRVHAALNVLCCLADAKHPVRTREVARSTSIPPAQAAKILYFLTWAGFASSRRGWKGGFWLRRSPERILIRDVMKFFLPPGDRGPEPGVDPVLKVWDATAGASHQAFERLTLADLIRVGDATQSLKCARGDGRDWRFFA